VSRSNQDLLVGTLVGGRYAILKSIGVGGMGVVYEAEDNELRRRVALKTLLVGSDESLARFHQEALATAQLGHPHVVPVLDFVKEPFPFIVMELLKGESLTERLKRDNVLPAPAACFVGVQVLSALEAAHKRGIVHRDIKPSNVFLIASPATGLFAKVLDFGIAKIADREGPRLSRAGEVLGSAPYMSPEAIRGEEVDHRTDIFSMGCMLYLMLTGRRPFEGRNPAHMMQAILEAKPVKPIAGIHPDLMALVQRALANDRFARFASAEEMMHELGRFALRVTLNSERVSAPATLRRGAKQGPDDEATQNDVLLVVWHAETLSALDPERTAVMAPSAPVRPIQTTVPVPRRPTFDAERTEEMPPDEQAQVSAASAPRASVLPSAAPGMPVLGHTAPMPPSPVVHPPSHSPPSAQWPRVWFKVALGAVAILALLALSMYAGFRYRDALDTNHDGHSMP
jgi:serine/threonine protein kinase